MLKLGAAPRKPLVAIATAAVVAGFAFLFVGMSHGAPVFGPAAAPTATIDACPQPPDWDKVDPTTLTDAQIAYYGLPPKPKNNSDVLARWVDVVRHAKHRVCGPGVPTNIRNGPANPAP